MIERHDIADIVARYRHARGALLPLLHAVQKEVGYIPDAIVPEIADALNISRAEVHGVVTFYHDFRRVPPGGHVIKLCKAEACQARGATAVGEAASRIFGLGWGETSADGRLTLEPVYCLGLCPIGPAALVDGRPMALLDAARIEALATELGG